MADQPPSSDDPASREYAKLHQRYWDAWLAMARQAQVQGGDGPGGTAPTAWAEALGRWWEAVAPAYAEAEPAMFEHLIPLGQAYLVFGEQALTLIHGLEAAAKIDKDWRQALQEGIARIREGFFQPFQGTDAAHPGLPAFWGLPLSTWQRIASSLPISLMSPAGTGLDQAWAAAVAGQTLKWQAQARQGGTLWREYQEVHRQYAQLLHDTANRSLDLLKEKLIARAETDRPITSVREFYNLWVDCGEEAYAQLIRSPEYADAHGRMLNALVRVRRQGQLVSDEILRTLNVPNRPEIDTVYERLQQARRRLARLEPSAERAGIERLEQLFNVLQEDIGMLRGELEAFRADATTGATDNRRGQRRSGRVAEDGKGSDE